MTFLSVSGTFTALGNTPHAAIVIGAWLGAAALALVLAPQLVRKPQCLLSVAALCGAFTGVFIGRALRLWRMAFHRTVSRLASQ